MIFKYINHHHRHHYHYHHHTLIPITGVGYINVAFPISIQLRAILLLKLNAQGYANLKSTCHVGQISAHHIKQLPIWQQGIIATLVRTKPVMKGYDQCDGTCLSSEKDRRSYMGPTAPQSLTPAVRSTRASKFLEQVP